MPYSPIQLEALHLISKYYKREEPLTIIPYEAAVELFEHRAEDVFKSLEREGVLLFIDSSFDCFKLKVFISTFDNFENSTELSTLSSSIVSINLNVTINQYISQIEQNPTSNPEIIDLLCEIRDELNESITKKKRIKSSLITRVRENLKTETVIADVLNKILIQIPIDHLFQYLL